MKTKNSRRLPYIELWAGIEATVNRVGDTYYDQIRKNGHHDRPEDLDALASLGIKTLRYPVLWERTAPRGPAHADWSWTDGRLHRIRKLGITPIVGLVHHGSGPMDTDLLDPAFPDKLAQYAEAVARRYPWVEYFTPVNEPLTTARFSALYGFWYPHAKDGRSFSMAFLNQMKATVMAMEAIRKVIPNAKLVQTEDLGKTYSTRMLEYQAEFENHRRWATYDFLYGNIDESHPMFQYFIWTGIPEKILREYLSYRFEPAIMGFNHYVTSERFLDHRLNRYAPSIPLADNGRDTYVDAEAVRVMHGKTAGVYGLLLEAWQRYGKPIAVTEAHLGCTREEQVRWLHEVIHACRMLKKRGVDIRACTAWSAFGIHNWNTLVTENGDYYEPGLYDVRSTPPRPTALAGYVEMYIKGSNEIPSVVSQPGWWKRRDRFAYSPARNTGNQKTAPAFYVRRRTSRMLAVIGASGTLGNAFARAGKIRGIPYLLLSRKDIDITNPLSVNRLLTQLQPWAVINAAGYVKVDDAENDTDTCMNVNAMGPKIIAESASRLSIPLVTFSSDLVFDGGQAEPYTENSTVHPLNIYGQSKALSEKYVLELLPDKALVIRTSSFFGPRDTYNFAYRILASALRHIPMHALSDCIVTPTYVPDLVESVLDLLIDREHGIWHLTNGHELSWTSFANQVISAAGLPDTYIRSVRQVDAGLPARRPAYSALGSNRGRILPSFDSAVTRFVAETKQSELFKPITGSGMDMAENGTEPSGIQSN